jgi:hypothetical protein
MHRRTIINVAVVAAVGATLAGTSFGATPKPIKKSFTYQDATPDPTASLDEALGGYGGCDEKVAPLKSAGFAIQLPGRGTLRVKTVTTGDWALDVRDAKGKVLGFSDGGEPQAQEAVTVKIKAAGKYLIVPCNLGGAPNATGTWEYKPA